MNKQNMSSSIALKDKVVAHHICDGSELIPGGIRVNIPKEISKHF